jgi:hypothetical protein
MPFEDHSAPQYNLYFKEETPGNDPLFIRMNKNWVLTEFKVTVTEIEE